MNEKWTKNDYAIASVPVVILVFLYYLVIKFIFSDRGTCMMDGCIQMLFFILFAVCLIEIGLFNIMKKYHKRFCFISTSLTIALLAIYYFVLMLE